MEFLTHPFDIKTVYAKTKNRWTKRLRGPDSPLYASIWPMVYVMRVFGFVPYTFSQDRLVPSNVYLIFSMIAAALYSYIIYVVLLRLIDVKREDPILGGTENMKVIINYCVVMYELGLAVFTRHSFTRTWNALQDYDEGVRQLGHPRKETRTRVVAWILTIVIAIVWILVNRSGMYSFSEAWIYNMTYLLPYIATSMALYKFVAMVFFLGQRFHHLNVIATTNLPPMLAIDKGTVISKKTILSMHNDLMIAAESLESLYSQSLFLWLGNLSFHTVANIYFIIGWILTKPWTTAWPLVYCLSFWLMAFLFQLLLLHIACDFTASQNAETLFQANSMGPILIEWQVRLMRKHEECVEWSLQFLNRKLKFSAGGFFYVHLPLLRSIAALLTTYLVLLLQLPLKVH